MFKYYKRNQQVDHEALLNYIIEEREINGQVVKVKVYPSTADTYIKHWRQQTEAAPVQKNYTGKGDN